MQVSVMLEFLLCGQECALAHCCSFFLGCRAEDEDESMSVPGSNTISSHSSSNSSNSSSGRDVDVRSCHWYFPLVEKVLDNIHYVQQGAPELDTRMDGHCVFEASAKNLEGPGVSDARVVALEDCLDQVLDQCAVHMPQYELQKVRVDPSTAASSSRPPQRYPYNTIAGDIVCPALALVLRKHIIVYKNEWKDVPDMIICVPNAEGSAVQLNRKAITNSSGRTVDHFDTWQRSVQMHCIDARMHHSVISCACACLCKHSLTT